MVVVIPLMLVLIVLMASANIIYDNNAGDCLED